MKNLKKILIDKVFMQNFGLIFLIFFDFLALLKNISNVIVITPTV